MPNSDLSSETYMQLSMGEPVGMLLGNFPVGFNVAFGPCAGLSQVMSVVELGRCKAHPFGYRLAYQSLLFGFIGCPGSRGHGPAWTGLGRGLEPLPADLFAVGLHPAQS